MFYLFARVISRLKKIKAHLIGWLLSTRFVYKCILYKMYICHNLNFDKNLFFQLMKKENIQNSTKVFLPMIETNHHGIFQLLGIAKALENRGSEVQILVCNGSLSGCEVKNINNIGHVDPCLTCKFQYDEILKKSGFKFLEIKNILSGKIKSKLEAIARTISTNYPTQFIYEGVDLIPIVDDSIIRYCYGDLNKIQSILQKLRFDHLHTALINIEIAKYIHQEFEPDLLLSNVAVYSAWAPYVHYFKSLNIPYWTISATANDDGAIIINLMDLFKNPNRFNRYKDWRGSKDLSSDEAEELEGFISQRKKGDFAVLRGLNLVDKGIEQILCMSKKKRNIFLFSNVYWDLVTTEKGAIFESMSDWVISTIDMLSQSPNTHLYIKPHPSELYSSDKSSWGVKNIILKHYGKLPHNVTIIDPELNISPYSLFDYIDLGIVFNGTLGLEMAIEDIPVIAVGRGPYTGSNVLTEPVGIEEYKEYLHQKKNAKNTNKNDIRLFAYFYFIKSCIPFPIVDRVWAPKFKGYQVKTDREFFEGKNYYLDHICNVILKNKLPEGWVKQIA